jgi:hypothetical protein
VLGCPTEQTPVIAVVGTLLGSDLVIDKHAWSEQRQPRNCRRGHERPRPHPSTTTLHPTRSHPAAYAGPAVPATRASEYGVRRAPPSRPDGLNRPPSSSRLAAMWRRLASWLQLTRKLRPSRRHSRGHPQRHRRTVRGQPKALETANPRITTPTSSSRGRSSTSRDQPKTFDYGTFGMCPVPLGPQHRPRMRRGRAQEKERT